MPETGRPRLTIWGCRGSIAVGGPGTVRHGGATSCVVIEEGPRRLVLDAGTGLRRYGRSLTPPDIPGPHTVLLTHTHWDHLIGLPFFPPLYHASATIKVLGPDQPGATLTQVLDRLLDPAVWPLQPSADLRVTPVGPGRFEAGGFSVAAVRVAHAGVTLGYRIDTESGGSVSYVTDNELAAMHPEERSELVQLVAGSDVLIHDATYADAQLAERAGWGHSSAEESVRLGLEAGCRTVLLFHHDPDADDALVDERLELARRSAGSGDMTVMAAADGLILEF